MIISSVVNQTYLLRKCANKIMALEYRSSILLFLTLTLLMTPHCFSIIKPSVYDFSKHF